MDPSTFIPVYDSSVAAGDGDAHLPLKKRRRVQDFTAPETSRPSSRSQYKKGPPHMWKNGRKSTTNLSPTLPPVTPATTPHPVTDADRLSRPNRDTTGERRQALVDDVQPGPSRPRESVLSDGGISEADEEEEEEGPFYTLRQLSRRSYRKNGAVDTTYEIKFNTRMFGKTLSSISEKLEDMFRTVLDEATVGLQDSDLGRVVIHHPSLNSPIVVHLRTLDLLTPEAIMEVILNYLNSNEALVLDALFRINVGIIRLLRGGVYKHITKLTGANNDIHLKRSLVQIVSNDNLCLARSIVVSWAKVHWVSNEEWRQSIAGTRGDTFCRALQLKKVPKWLYAHLLDRKRTEQRRFAEIVCCRAGVSLNVPATLNDIPKFEAALDVRICVVSSALGNKFIRVPPPDSPQNPLLYVYHVQQGDDDIGHFHAISSITGVLKLSYFCETCLKGYSNREKHACETYCIVCKTADCLVTDEAMSCSLCHMTCRSLACFERHNVMTLNRDVDKRQSQCQKWHRCKTCFKVFKTSDRPVKDHTCGEWCCSTCSQYVVGQHLCYQRCVPLQEVSRYRYLFFDFECNQDSTSECSEGYAVGHCASCTVTPCIKCKKCFNCNDPTCGSYTHRPNYVVCHKVCNKCVLTTISTKCDHCGDRCVDCNALNDKGTSYDRPPCHGCGSRERIFEGPNTARQFGEYLFDDQHRAFTVLAHNLKGYDGYFILEYLLDQSIFPEKIIYSGSKIMYMSVGRGLDIRLLDSLNFLPMKLAALPKAFGLQELKKGWFPHFFNTKENQQYIGPFPEVKYYGHDMMSSGERADFLAWHSSQSQVFDFREEMKTYCVSDVTILREACMCFRKLMISVTSENRQVFDDKSKRVRDVTVAVDPFRHTTIASVCMAVYKGKYFAECRQVEAKHKQSGAVARVAITSQNNDKVYVLDGSVIAQNELASTWSYDPSNGVLTSAIARVPTAGYGVDQYSAVSILWLQWLNVSEHLSIQHALNNREHQVPGSKYKLDGYDPVTHTAYEFNGCLFHGCPQCFPDRQMKHPLTRQSYEELFTLTRKKESFLKVHGYRVVSIWECDFGRLIRHNPDLSAFVKAADIQPRLDPRDSFFGGRTNASKLYCAAGEGERIRYIDFTSLYPYVNKYCEYPRGHPEIITKPVRDLSVYFGIAMVKILPPRGLYHPVLPYRSCGKLKFPLCRTCADEEALEPCQCSDVDRCLLGTWCIPELNKAVEKGYTLLRVYEVYHWPERMQYDADTKQGGLFTPYVNAFLKLKQQASGWPGWCQTETDKGKYISDYYEREGISLDYASVQKNPGLRSLAKLCLNSFWGKFGQRLNMPQSEFIHDSCPERFFSLLSDPLKTVTDFHIVNNHTIHLKYELKSDSCVTDDKTNIFIASFTTCWARLKLYDLLDRLQRQILYYDTDSIIYVSNAQVDDPPLGDYLGELTDELDAGEYIVEFVSGGPKNYAYKTSSGVESCKVRGFTLNFTNSRLINFSAVKELVTRRGDNLQVTTVNPNKICRNVKTNSIYNREEMKHYKVVYTKRVIQDDYDTLPYGY